MISAQQLNDWKECLVEDRTVVLTSGAWLVVSASRAQSEALKDLFAELERLRSFEESALETGIFK